MSDAPQPDDDNPFMKALFQTGAWAVMTPVIHVTRVLSAGGILKSAWTAIAPNEWAQSARIANTGATALINTLEGAVDLIKDQGARDRMTNDLNAFKETLSKGYEAGENAVNDASTQLKTLVDSMVTAITTDHPQLANVLNGIGDAQHRFGGFVGAITERVDRFRGGKGGGGVSM